MDKKLEKVIEMGNILQTYLEEFCPPNEAKTQALLKTKEALMWAYASITVPEK
ncbi:MAG: hypothetical protein ACRCW9_03830 [Cetobacterium sp.]